MRVHDAQGELRVDRLVPAREAERAALRLDFAERRQVAEDVVVGLACELRRNGPLAERIDKGGFIAARLLRLLAKVVERKFLLARELCRKLVARHAQQVVERLLEVGQRDVRLVDAAREADDGDARLGRLRRDAAEKDGHEGSQQQGGQTLP